MAEQLQRTKSKVVIGLRNHFRDEWVLPMKTLLPRAFVSYALGQNGARWDRVDLYCVDLFVEPHFFLDFCLWLSYGRGMELCDSVYRGIGRVQWDMLSAMMKLGVPVLPASAAEAFNWFVTGCMKTSCPIAFSFVKCLRSKPAKEWLLVPASCCCSDSWDHVLSCPALVKNATKIVALHELILSTSDEWIEAFPTETEDTPPVVLAAAQILSVVSSMSQDEALAKCMTPVDGDDPFWSTLEAKIGKQTYSQLLAARLESKQWLPTFD